MKKRTKTEKILKILLLLAWFALIGFLIEGGAILTTFTFSWYNPEAARDLYSGLNLYELRQYSFSYYAQSVAMLVILSILKAYVSFLVIRTLSKFNITNPFTSEVARKLEKISYYAFGIWVVTILHNAHLTWLLKKTGVIYGTQISAEFIFVIGLVYFFSQVFKRGVEIQSENELMI